MLEKFRLLFNNKLGVYYNKILLIIFVLLLFSFIGDLSRVGKADSKIDEAQNRLDKLAYENQELEKQVEGVNSQEFVERQIRDKLNLAKEGEIVLVLPDDEVLRKIAPKRIEEDDLLPDPNWKEWIELFL